MTDNDKAKSAKDRLEAAKKAAEDAEVVSEAPNIETLATDASEKAAEASEAASDLKETVENGADAAANAVEETTDAANEAVEDAVEAADVKASGEDAEEAFVDVASEDPPETPQPAPTPAPAPQGRSFAATALTWLVVFLVGAVAALFVGPKVAPYLPASVAQYLAPASGQTEEALAALRAETEAANAALTERVDAAEAKLAAQAEEAATARSDLAASLEGRIAAAEAAKADTSAISAAVDAVAGRVTQAEATLVGIRKEVDGLSGLGGEYAAPSAETLERVAAFGAAVEGLRAEVAALSAATAGMDALAPRADLAALAERVEALEGGEAATASAAEEADRIRQTAKLDAALTRIGEALVAGRAFAEPLDAAETLSGAAAPEALKAAAETGAPTLNRLIRSFQDAAQAGYAAALEADAGEGTGSRMFASLQGRLGGRPSVETEGEDAGAVLSRIEARLKEGDAAAAQAEAATLPEAAKGAMTGWLASLDKSASARTALAEYRAALTAN